MDDTDVKLRLDLARDVLLAWSTRIATDDLAAAPTDYLVMISGEMRELQKLRDAHPGWSDQIDYLQERLAALGDEFTKRVN